MTERSADGDRAGQPERERRPFDDPALKTWTAFGFAALIVIVVVIPLSVFWTTDRESGSEPWQETPSFVGTAACKDCHQAQYDSWLGSDHDLAMDVATEGTVLGDFGDREFTHAGVTSRFYKREGRFYVWTEGTGGEMGEFEITHTFGVEPLQQYLVPFPGGRLQALSLAWDVEREEWFYVYPGERIPPDDWLHWTRNGQN